MPLPRLDALFLSVALILSLPVGAQTLSERMGYPSDSKLLILHGDDLGMCRAANEAARIGFTRGFLSSGSVMVPCPAFEEMARWSQKHPDHDLGLHLTLNAEWSSYRWSSISDPALVPGLIDPEGFLWKNVADVLQHSNRKEVETELRAQIRHARSAGLEPTHLDSHMGTLFSSASFFLTYLRVARQENIVAMVPRPAGKVLRDLKSKGLEGLAQVMLRLADKQGFPIVDRLESVDGHGYQERKAWLLQLIETLEPGVTEVIFHPSTEGPEIRKITRMAQNRIDDHNLLLDPEIRDTIKRHGIQIVQWREINNWWNRNRKR